MQKDEYFHWNIHKCKFISSNCDPGPEGMWKDAVRARWSESGKISQAQRQQKHWIKTAQEGDGVLLHRAPPNLSNQLGCQWGLGRGPSPPPAPQAANRLLWVALFTFQK